MKFPIKLKMAAKGTGFSWFRFVVMVLGGLVLLFIVAPLLGMFIHTPLSDVAHTATESEVTNSVWLTIWVSMAATVVFAIAAIPFAYFLARNNFPLKKVVLGIIDLPVVIPHSAAGIALLGIISKQSVIGGMFSSLGIELVGTRVAIAMAMAFVSIPFLINAAREGFAMVPEKLEKTALTLGASPFQVFFTISLPLAWRSVVSGLVLMFARGMSEFGAVIIVAYHPMVAPILIFERFNQFGLKYARPVTVIFIVISLLVFIALRLIANKKIKND